MTGRQGFSQNHFVFAGSCFQLLAVLINHHVAEVAGYLEVEAAAGRVRIEADVL